MEVSRPNKKDDNVMKIAIAILNWNGKKWLEKFLPSVILHSQNAEIHIIDNASTDDSVAFVKAHFPSVKIIINKKNKGFAGGYNEGLKSIDADIFCLLNSDVEVTENWLTPIIDLFKKDSDIAVVQPKVLDYSRKEYFEFAGAGGGMIDNLGYPYCRGRIFEKVEKDHGQYNDETEIFWASGCAFFIRSKDFWSENGFDERFFAHQEEIDLCWRLKNKNKKVFYCGQSEIYHIGGATLQKQSPRKTYLNFRNNLSMLLKNLPSPLLFPLIFFRLCLDGIAGVRFLLQGKWKHTLAIIKAHFGFYAQAKTTFKMRSQHQMKNYFQTKWIIFRHFL